MGALRYAARILAKSPGFSVVAIVTLALGIGANTSIFTVANALLLRPLPYQEPERLVLVSAAKAASPLEVLPFSYPRFALISGKSHSFSDIAAFTNETFNLTGLGQPEQLAAARVSWNFFEVLGLRPARGRGFLEEEDQPGGRPVCVISHRLWTRRFGARPDAVGKALVLDSTPYTVAGILPRDFDFVPLGEGIDVLAPKPFELNLATPEQIRAGAGYLRAVGRLKPGVQLSQAQAEMDVLNVQYRRENPHLADADPSETIRAADLQEQTVANIRPALLILCCAVGLVLLIACANVAALLLSRALSRRKEIAIRAALGARRGRIVGQLLLESTLLALAAGVLGTLLSALGARALISLGHDHLPRLGEIRFDWRVPAFTAGLSLLTGVLFGLLPALQLSRADLNTVLRSEGRGSTGSRMRNLMRSSLVAAQVALSMVLLVGAGLLIRSFVQLRSVKPGFDEANVLTMRVALAPARYPNGPRMVAFFEQAVQQASGLPGVQSAAVASALPVNPTRFSPVLVEGQPEAPLGARPLLAIQMVSPGYFQTLRIPLRKGRAFSEADNDSAALVAVVNEAMVRRFWPNRDPIGRHLFLGRMTKPTQVVTVVGMAADVSNLSLAAAPQAEVYLPFAQRPWASMNLLLRTAGDPRNWSAAGRAAVAAVDRDQPVTDINTMEDVLASSTAPQRFSVFLLGVFSVTALALAAVGLYGTIAYSVAERTQEMGIRIAMGAEARDILRMVVGQGVAIAAAGLAIGAVSAFALTRLMSGLLFQVSSSDPASFAGSALLFMAIAAFASYVPARRATRVAPTDALRHD